MNVFELTRALVDIESITNNEERVGHYLYDYLAPLAARFDGRLERIEVEPRASTCSRSGALAHRHAFTTWIPCLLLRLARRWRAHLGARLLRHKGIIASMIKAPRRCSMPATAISACCSWWARSATAPAPTVRPGTPRGSRYIVNGEPTENKMALGSKGALRYEAVATGKMAHSAYPELGDSHPQTGRRAGRYAAHPAARGPAARAEQLNIGTLSGAAPNVIADEARAESWSAWWAIPPKPRLPCARRRGPRGVARDPRNPALRLNPI